MSRVVFAAVAATCALFSGAFNVHAQEAPTPGGDVTADEAAVLPPVVVQSPSEPIAQRIRPHRKPQAMASPTGATGAKKSEQQVPGEGAPGTGLSEFAPGGTGSGPAIGFGIFTLGQLDMIGGSSITNEAMYTFNKNSLDQAVGILPGVSSHNSGGSRNERDVYVRGFNRLQVPLSIDGVRIYLPYDNRLDIGRFVTPDLAEVQVEKGYVSVLNGPGGEGGAINLVSRRPEKEVELEGRVGAVFNGDVSELNQWNSYAYAGTRQKGYYAQVSGVFVDQDKFNLSNDFVPATIGTAGFPYALYSFENGGDRDHSAFQDWRINTKVGITPNATDEYSINYTKQEGDKDAPLHVDRQIVQGYSNIQGNSNAIRFWDWPQWDVSTLSWLSKTQIGEASYIKTNAYYNTFDNITAFRADQTYTPATDSYYLDYAYGGFVEAGTNLIPMNTLKAAIHYRRDVHNEFGINYPYVGAVGPQPIVTPTTNEFQDTYSFAAEDTFHVSRNVDLVAGTSYDINQVLAVPTGLAAVEANAWNWQGAAIYRYSETGKLHADVSSRTRFPTLFERYSTRFGSKDPNPNITPERATNYEVGVSDTYFRNVTVSSNVFYSDLDDQYLNAFSAANGKNSIVGYNADGHNYGFEFSADWDVTHTVRVGGNYTYLERAINFGAAAQALPIGTTAAAINAVGASQIENTPRHEAFIYLAWRPTEKLTLTPSLELASDRNVLVTSCASTLVADGGNPAGPPNANNGNCGNAAGHFTGRPNYIDLGAYALVNFQAEYALNPNTTLSAGATNLFDENYSLADGFPEAGRQFFATLRAKF